MRLAIPVFIDGKIFTDYEHRPPKGSTLADTSETMSREGAFQAIIVFLTGCIREFSALDGSRATEAGDIRKIVAAMPYVSAEAAALKIMATVNPGDKIEGVYDCPRCGKKITTGLDQATGEDNRDTIEALPVTYLELNEKQVYEEIVYFDLDEPITITDKRDGTVIDEILEIGLKWPTLTDLLNGSKRYPNEDTRRQFATYASALVSVNSESKPAAYKATWGMYIFNEMGSEDLRKISAVMKKYGISKTVNRQCAGCGKTWEAPVNTAGFFASGLQPE
jgi:hypothetical protein